MRDRSATQGLMVFGADDSLEERMASLRDVFSVHKGTCPVQVRFDIEGEEVSVLLRDENDIPVCVQPSEDLCDNVERLFGRPVLTFM